MQVPADTVVDYIVVGAGSAGSVIANKLSENGRYQVLLLEQGKPDSSVLLSMPKGFGAVLAGEEYVARYPVCRPQGEPTSEVWLRGKTLGGSSAVNGMIWARPRPEGMARLAKAGGEAWAWHNIEPLLDELDGGGSGPGVIKVSTHARHLGIVEAFVGAAASAGLARRQGIRDKAQEEVAYPFYNIDTRGRRCSAATGFLKGARKRPNLSVETAVRVDRIVFDGGRAHALLAERHGHRLGFSARREIILCAGALESPQILQRSGIGPRAVLDAAGIPVVCEREGVGRNLREHFLLGLNFQVKSTRDSENREYAGLSLVRNLARYFLTRKGPMAQSPCHAVASLASGEAGASADIQLMVNPFSRKGQGFDTVPGVSIVSYPVYPESSGEVSITGADCNSRPRIVPNYLSSEKDCRAALAGVRGVRRIAACAPLVSRFVGESAQSVDARTDADILQLYRSSGMPGFHAVGTCAMGSTPSAVVDARARVLGVEGVRVVDASIFPEMLVGITNASIMVVAMRAAELILEDAER